MAALRPTASAAAQLMRATGRPMLAAAAPALRRFESTAAPTTPAVTEVQPKSAAPQATRFASLAPDYTAMTDRATSDFTPVPKRVLNGSEDNEALPAAVLSGAPMELEARTVRIYKPAKSAMQSGTWHGSKWRMDWDVLGKGHRWENPLMGWQSSADFMQGTHINFKSKEDAIAFAEKQGYEYYVQEPQTRKFRPKAYANNFLYSAGKLKQVRTK